MGIDKNSKINDIDQGTCNWILVHLKKLRTYLENKSGQKLQDIPDPKFLDKYFPGALADMQVGQINEDDLINMFGVGLGQYLEEKAGFQWVIHCSKDGNDLAVQHKGTQVIGFPLSSAAKRVDDQHAGNFDAIFHALTTWK